MFCARSARIAQRLMRAQAATVFSGTVAVDGAPLPGLPCVIGTDFAFTYAFALLRALYKRIPDGISLCTCTMYRMLPEDHAFTSAHLRARVYSCEKCRQSAAGCDARAMMVSLHRFYIAPLTVSEVIESDAMFSYALNILPPCP